MNISKVGIDLVKHFEGCLLYGYRDVVGVPTIGYGHTGGVVVGHKITQAEADALLKKDLSRFAYGVEELVKVYLNQNQFDALTSFSFNLGLGALQRSTLLKKLNAKDYVGASKEFAKFNKGRIDGELVPLKGLTRRRAAEAALFSKPVSKPSVPVKKPVVTKPVAQVPYPNQLLRKGMMDNKNVKVLQKKLGLVADGDFGTKTDVAVRAFQKKNRLKIDGIVGKATWDKLF